MITPTLRAARNWTGNWTAATIFFLAIVPFAAQSDAPTPEVREYAADLHESEWIVSSSGLGCQLRHPIPRYGTAVFERVAGGELEFRLPVHHAPVDEGLAALSSVEPNWRHTHTGRGLGEASVTPQNAPISLGRARALRLLSELEAGLHPVLRYQDWVDGRDVIQVRLSAVSFLDSVTPFRQCLKTLLPFNFDDIRLTRVHFDTDKHKLNAAGRRALDRIVLYLKAGGVIQQVLVRGHTDWVGRRRYNDTLSKRRAASVRAYLTEKEVPDALIQNSHFGESQPLASNKTTTGRAANRRVTLELTQ